MRVPMILALAALTVVAGCDNNKPSTQSGGTPAQVAQALPPEIAQTAGNVNGALWIDAPFTNGSCRPRDAVTYDGRLGLQYKSDNVPWPPVQANGELPDTLPKDVWLTDQAHRTILDDAVAGLRNENAIHEINGDNGLNDAITCIQFLPEKLGDSLNLFYNSTTHRAVHAMVLVGSLKLDRVELVSEFDRSRPYEGIVAKHRKYHLFANFVMNPVIGSERVTLERDIVIYFDPEDRVWRFDRYDSQNWSIQTRTNPIIPRVVAPIEAAPHPSPPPAPQSTPAPATPAPVTPLPAPGMDNENGCGLDNGCRRLVFSAAGESDAVSAPQSGAFACMPATMSALRVNIHLWKDGSDLGVFPLATKDANGVQRAVAAPAYDRIAFVRADPTLDHLFVWFTRNGACY